MRWDPEQYARYGDERARPFLDLLARVGAQTPRRVVDLGCGPGTLTALLARRWPGAHVEGIDSSAEMLSAAPAGDLLSFRRQDVLDWEMPADADVVLSNATLQWVPGHVDLLRSWAEALPVGGWLAWQVPGNFGSPAHRLMREYAQRWGAAAALRHDDAVADPETYADVLLAAGLRADVWETTYVHVLAGADPVLDWVRGTGLRPVLTALDPADIEPFETEYGAALRAAYPPRDGATLFPFRRIFAVGHKA